MKRILKYSVAAATLASLLVPVAALALVQPTVPIGGTGQGVTGTTIKNLLNEVANFLITASVVVAVIVIVWGGVQALRGGWDKAKETLTKAAIGLAIIFGVGLIMQTISKLVQTQSIG